MIVQIYEIQTPQEADKCIDLGVDHIGSVLLSKNGWQVPALKEVIHLTENTSTKSNLIPLFQDIETLKRALDYYQPHYVHFCESLTDSHGKERDLEGFIEFQSRLKQDFPEIGIMRSIPIPQKAAALHFPSLEIARALEPVSDIFLTDTWLGKEPVHGYVGITGKRADWEMERKLVIQSEIPVILAGGLSPENAYRTLMRVMPAGADSCTKTNMKDESGKPVRFKKDFKKVKQFVQEVRRAEHELRSKRELLEKKLNEQKADLREREAALPAHSVRPNQIIAIEALEEEIASNENELKRFRKI